jgi:hypothetical protein
MDSKATQQKSPFYMPLFLQLKLLFFSHHSSSSTPYKLYSFKGLLAYDGVITGATKINNY